MGNEGSHYKDDTDYNGQHYAPSHVNKAVSSHRGNHISANTASRHQTSSVTNNPVRGNHSVNGTLVNSHGNSGCNLIHHPGGSLNNGKPLRSILRQTSNENSEIDFSVNSSKQVASSPYSGSNKAGSLPSSSSTNASLNSEMIEVNNGGSRPQTPQVQRSVVFHKEATMVEYHRQSYVSDDDQDDDNETLKASKESLSHFGDQQSRLQNGIKFRYEPLAVENKPYDPISFNHLDLKPRSLGPKTYFTPPSSRRSIDLGHNPFQGIEYENQQEMSSIIQEIRQREPVIVSNQPKGYQLQAIKEEDSLWKNENRAKMSLSSEESSKFVHVPGKYRAPPPPQFGSKIDFSQTTPTVQTKTIPTKHPSSKSSSKDLRRSYDSLLLSPKSSSSMFPTSLPSHDTSLPRHSSHSPFQSRGYSQTVLHDTGPGSPIQKNSIYRKHPSGDPLRVQKRISNGDGMDNMNERDRGDGESQNDETGSQTSHVSSSKSLTNSQSDFAVQVKLSHREDNDDGTLRSLKLPENKKRITSSGIVMEYAPIDISFLESQSSEAYPLNSGASIANPRLTTHHQDHYVTLPNKFRPSTSTPSSQPARQHLSSQSFNHPKPIFEWETPAVTPVSTVVVSDSRKTRRLYSSLNSPNQNDLRTSIPSSQVESPKPIPDKELIPSTKSYTSASKKKSINYSLRKMGHSISKRFNSLGRSTASKDRPYLGSAFDLSGSLPVAQNEASTYWRLGGSQHDLSSVEMPPEDTIDFTKPSLSMKQQKTRGWSTISGPTGPTETKIKRAMVTDLWQQVAKSSHENLFIENPCFQDENKPMQSNLVPVGNDTQEKLSSDQQRARLEFLSLAVPRNTPTDTKTDNNNISFSSHL